VALHCGITLSRVIVVGANRAVKGFQEPARFPTVESGQRPEVKSGWRRIRPEGETVVDFTTCRFAWIRVRTHVVRPAELPTSRNRVPNRRAGR